MRAIYFLVAIFAFASAHATDWDELVQDRDTVAIVQQTLRAEGYDPGPINGEFGPQTAAALKQAQKDRELEPTGRLDRRTIGSCDELLGPEKEGCLKQGGTIETRAAR